MPLTMAKIGEVNFIKRVNGHDEAKRHLEDLGFAAGGSVVIVSKSGGNFIVNVRESRIAISGEMANKIFV